MTLAHRPLSTPERKEDMQKVLRSRPRTRWGTLWSATALALLLAGTVTGQNPPPQKNMPMTGVPARDADFQPYIFWAYGLACALLFLFMLWTLAQARRTRARIDYLEDRLRRAYPDVGGARAP
jgi:hypothetical protein